MFMVPELENPLRKYSRTKAAAPAHNGVAIEVPDMESTAALSPQLLLVGSPSPRADCMPTPGRRVCGSTQRMAILAHARTHTHTWAHNVWLQTKVGTRSTRRERCNFLVTQDPLAEYMCKHQASVGLNWHQPRLASCPCNKSQQACQPGLIRKRRFSGPDGSGAQNGLTRLRCYHDHRNRDLRP